MKFYWRDTPTYYRCTSERPVKIKARTFSGHYNTTLVTDMGYIIPRDGRLLANIYGSVNPDSPGKFFDNIDEAKRYVEKHALLGLTLNKLTR